MNQVQQTANLIQTAAVASNYLGRTNRGAITVPMRHSAIFAMNGLSIAVQNEQALNANLQAQNNLLTNHNARLTSGLKTREAEIIRLAAERVSKNQTIKSLKEEQQEKVKQDERAKKELEEFNSSMKKKEAEKEALTKSYTAALEDAEKKYKKDLSIALEKLESTKESNKKMLRVLTFLLDFAQTESSTITGWMLKKYGQVDKNFNKQLSALAKSVQECGEDLETDDVEVDVMLELVTRLEQSRLFDRDSTWIEVEAAN